VRNLGRLGTWIAGKIETGESNVRVYLPDYDNVLLGTATIPRIVVSVRNGQATDVDVMAHVEPGEADGIRTIANDWLGGNLERIRLQGKADVRLKSGIFPLGTQSVSENLVFEGQSLYSPIVQSIAIREREILTPTFSHRPRPPSFA